MTVSPISSPYPCKQKPQYTHYEYIAAKKLMADREGFEPSVPVCGTHTFQACSFDHSDTCPLEIVLDRKAGIG